MPIDPGALGAATQVYRHAYDWKSLVLYALGIGARRDELMYLYENAPGGFRSYPTYAVVPAFPPVVELLGRAKADLAMVVHGGQKVVAHRPLPPSGELETIATLKGVYDLKRFAQLVITTESRHQGEVVFDTEWSIIVRAAGGFGGERPPSAHDLPSVPKDRTPDWTEEQTTSPEQALLYRLSGDVNPLHADPPFAASVGFTEGPILHGLCTYGFAARALVRRVADGDARRLRTLEVQFRKPVWPGDTIVTSGWSVGAGKHALVATVKGRPEAVITNAWADVA